MYRFTKRYLSSLACLLLAMGLYSLILVPLIEPPARQRPPLPTFTGALGGEQWWQDLFPADSWQTDDPKIVQSKNREILLSHRWEQTGPKTLKLEPLTMILPHKSPEGSTALGKSMAQQDVWIISAQQGAVIHFENALDLTSGTIPSIERGQLSGAIEISHVARGRRNEKLWTLRTRELSIDRSRVSTPQSVTMEWPEGIIQGHDLRLTLQGDLLGAPRQASSPWGPLRNLELYHIDRIDIALEDGGIWAGNKLPRPDNAPAVEGLPARLKIDCGGRFAFDFGRSQATLLGGVHVVHQLENLPADEFLSQEVVIDVAPPAGASEQTPLSEEFSWGGLQVRQFEATGVDPLENFVGEKNVELRAPTIAAYAKAKRLKIDLLEKRIELDGKLAHPGATQSTAWLEYLGYQFTSARIDYDADGDGSLPFAEHLGYLVAQGAGELRMPTDSQLGSGLVRWQQSLKMQPTETPGLQWIGLFGGVLVESNAHGYMASENLDILLRKTATATESGISNDGLPASGESLQSYRPEKLHATGKINLSTPQVTAHVSELTLALNFVPVPSSAGQPQQESLALSDSAGRPMYQWLQPPEAAQSPSNGPGIMVAQNATPAAAASNPAVISGSTMDSSIIIAGDRSWVDYLTITGPLDVTGSPDSTADATAPTTSPAWRVTGDRLQMATNPDGQVDLQVTGAPARIMFAHVDASESAAQSAPQFGSLAGPIIRLDQQKNLIWMDQPGEFTMPPAALSSRGKATPRANLSGLQWFEPPRCTWQGKMLFDGQAVRIEGDIRFQGAFRTLQNQFWWIDGASEALLLEFATPIDLMRPQVATAEPAHITLSRNVNILAASRDHLGNKRSREQMQLPSLTFDIQSNEISGLGPGSIRSWHLSTSGMGNRLAGPETTDKQETLQGAHLQFRESMRGFMDRSEIYFQGHVELAAGPLASWEDAIDLATMKQLSMDQMMLSSDLLKAYDTSSLSSTASLNGEEVANQNWEFQAKGNVNFAGKTKSGDYEGSATELVYVQALEQLRLFGEPRRPASLKRTPAPGSPQGVSNISVEYAAINTRTLEVPSYKMGENGISWELPTGAPAGTVGPGQTLPGVLEPQTPNNAVRNPRAGVSDFFQRK